MTELSEGAPLTPDQIALCLEVSGLAKHTVHAFLRTKLNESNLEMNALAVRADLIRKEAEARLAEEHDVLYDARLFNNDLMGCGIRTDRHRYSA